MSKKTLLVGLAHPDDEVGVAGTILAHREQGHRVLIAWLTRGEMTAAYGDIPSAEVARHRTDMGERAARMLDSEAHFFDLPDTRLAPGPGPAAEVAGLIAKVQPDAVLTWGDAWIRGMRHPDHQACGQIFRDAVVVARIAAVVHPLQPHRGPAPVFTLRDVHSFLPAVAIDVEPYIDRILELGRFYREQIGFGDSDWIRSRLSHAGREWGLRYAEVFDAWETDPGRVRSLFEGGQAGPPPHPDREGGRR
jgi:N-acetylglucosamine malate deacetylase 1